MQTIFDAPHRKSQYTSPYRQAEVELIAEDLLSCARELCTRGHFVMIALGADGKPTAVAPLPVASG